MSPVEFKKRSCRPVEFKGQGSQCDLNGVGQCVQRSVLYGAYW